ncbi:MAG TPA: hypothetical protein VEX86_17990 [Longimicrobium sp.]|nr:hypothetical protein [Longimicrobium sp.]
MEQPSAVRARFTGGRRYDCRAEDRTVDASQLSVRSLNFGQHWRTDGIVDVAYEVALPLAFAVHVIASSLDDYVDDCVRHPSDDPLEAALRARGWPGADAILADAALQEEMFATWGHDMLLAWLGDLETRDGPGWVINTIEASSVDGDVVTIRGKARRAGQPVRYQDV